MDESDEEAALAELTAQLTGGSAPSPAPATLAAAKGNRKRVKALSPAEKREFQLVQYVSNPPEPDAPARLTCRVCHITMLDDRDTIKKHIQPEDAKAWPWKPNPDSAHGKKLATAKANLEIARASACLPSHQRAVLSRRPVASPFADLR